METTLQHVHETYGDQHDQHVGVGSVVAERELQKIEKEKKKLDDEGTAIYSKGAYVQKRVEKDQSDIRKYYTYQKQ